MWNMINLPQLPFLLPSLPLEKGIQSRQQECKHILALIEYFIIHMCWFSTNKKIILAVVRLRVSELCSDGLMNTSQNAGNSFGNMFQEPWKTYILLLFS